jgi:hypothetical protein
MLCHLHSGKFRTQNIVAMRLLHPPVGQDVEMSPNPRDRMLSLCSARRRGTGRHVKSGSTIYHVANFEIRGKYYALKNAVHAMDSSRLKIFTLEYFLTHAEPMRKPFSTNT